MSQVDEIAKEFSEIQEYYQQGFGTINVQFEPRILVVGSDHRTRMITWGQQKQKEMFDFVRVKLSFAGLNKEVRGLMYVAYDSAHRQDSHIHEFLVAEKIDNLREGTQVEMECVRSFAELPYTDSSQESGGLRLAKTLVIL